MGCTKAAASHQAEHKIEGAYLVYAAPIAAWCLQDQPAELFGSGTHQISTLLSTCETQWRWLLQGNKSARPVELSAQFTTDLVASVPILSAEHAPWEIRSTRISTGVAGHVRFLDGWPAESRKHPHQTIPTASP